ncbi:F-box only protein 48-like [Saccopteryx bilineata]|uniref:F-box only protein 48-like n=1 Tax=Saccopteryx bilineata TaxID=59482 RepID=UPI00338FD67C
MQNNSNMNSNSVVSDRELNSVDAEEEHKESHNNFVERLPSELTENIFSYLDCQSLGRASMTCKSWNSKITTDDLLWKPHCLALRPACDRKIDDDLKNGYSFRETFLRNYQMSKVKRAWLSGKYSNITSYSDLPENSMCVMDAEMWGEILDAQMKSDDEKSQQICHLERSKSK